MALPHDPRPRTEPAMPSSHPLPPSCHWFSALAAALDPRSAPRLAWLLVGAVLARGRRTVTSWIRAARLSAEVRPSYTAVVAPQTTVVMLPRRPPAESSAWEVGPDAWGRPRVGAG